MKSSISATAELHNGKTVRYFPEQKIGEGTEKDFYLTEDKNLVIGFYKDQAETADPERQKRLQRIIADFNPVRDREKGEFWEKHFCWPFAIVTSPRIGILSPRFPDQYFFSDGKGEKKGKWFSAYRLAVKLPKNERGSLLNRIRICRHLSRAVGRMHNAGLAHSDLSGNNVLMDPQKEICMIIDVDSLVVRGIFPSKVLGTRGYIAPEIVRTSHLPLHHPRKELPNIKTDLHSLAVIIYETLLLRHPLEGKKVHSDDPDEDDRLSFGKKALFIENPSDDSNLPEKMKMPYTALGCWLSPLFERTFTEGLINPDARPTALEWEDALIRTEDMLHPCPNKDCWYAWFVYLGTPEALCPFCEEKIPHSIPLMHLFRFYQKGQYISEKRYLTLSHQKAICEWHTRCDLSPPSEADNYCAEKGIFFLKNGKWFFRNKSNQNMHCASGKKIYPGESLGLSEGETVLLHPSQEGRIGVFEFPK
ncbi:MAG: hypothetical protein V2I97_17090 [Desulfococcaceae bacterium]|jgi:hypothetical protein|nr:hypothetical protein [Desulfococcaceae bacterium]